MVEAFRVSLVLYAEHSFDASTFTARVVTSTLSDLHSAVTAAVGALKGPLHGGANEAVWDTFEEVGLGEGSAERAAEWMREALAARRKIMGFGHRVYRSGDSRVPTMHAALVRLAHGMGRRDVLDLYDGLARAMADSKGIAPNLDFPSGPAYHLMGFDTPLFTPLFVASRVTGWTAHVMEQRVANSLIRPSRRTTDPPSATCREPRAPFAVVARGRHLQAVRAGAPLRELVSGRSHPGDRAGSVSAARACSRSQCSASCGGHPFSCTSRG